MNVIHSRRWAVDRGLLNHCGGGRVRPTGFRLTGSIETVNRSTQLSIVGSDDIDRASTNIYVVDDVHAASGRLSALCGLLHVFTLGI